MALAHVASSQPAETPDETLLPSMIILPTAKAAATDAAAAKPEAGKPEGGKSEGGKPEAGKPETAVKAKVETSADYLAQCLRDWDAATHMTRQEWSRTCRRVASSRPKYPGDLPDK